MNEFSATVEILRREKSVVGSTDIRLASRDSQSYTTEHFHRIGVTVVRSNGLITFSFNVDELFKLQV